jgi:hypothetical protein
MTKISMALAACVWSGWMAQACGSILPQPQPQLIGYPANPFVSGSWRSLDIDEAKRTVRQP